MSKITLKLSELIEDVYGIKLDEVCDGDNFYFNFDFIEVEEEDREKARVIINNHDKNLNVSEEELDNAIRNSKIVAFEESYINEYYEVYTEQLEEKIIEDFNNIQDFMTDELEENNIEGSFKVELSWKDDTIDFIGNSDVLEVIIIGMINGYGSFYYEDLKDFKSSNYEDDTQRRIEGHIYWLKYTEDIYGTIYNFFKFDSKYVDYYGTLGNTDFEDDIFLSELAC